MYIIETRDLGTIEGFDIKATLVPDDDAEDSESPYGVIVTASKQGINLGSDSLWMTDAQGFDDDGEDFMHGYGPDMIAAAIDAAQAKLGELTA